MIAPTEQAEWKERVLSSSWNAKHGRLTCQNEVAGECKLKPCSCSCIVGCTESDQRKMFEFDHYFSAHVEYVFRSFGIFQLDQVVACRKDTSFASQYQYLYPRIFALSFYDTIRSSISLRHSNISFKVPKQRKRIPFFSVRQSQVRSLFIRICADFDA